MEQVKLSNHEIMAMMTLFLVGTTIVVGMDFTLGRDVWIAQLLSAGFGCALLYVYLYLHRLQGWDNLISLLEKGFGKAIGSILGLLYCLYFLYIAARVVRDFSFFISTVLFHQADNWVIILTFLLAVLYTLRLGVEAIGRSALLFLLFGVVMILFLIVFGLFSPQFEIQNFTPFLQSGWKEVMKSVFPRGITFPFGELIVFMMIFPYSNDHQNLMRYAWVPVCITALLLVLAGVMIIGIMSPELASFFIFPFVKSVEIITFLQVFQHLEIIAVLLNLLGGYIKFSIFLYAGVQGFRQIFRLKQRLWHLFLAGILVFLLSFTFSQNIIQHLEVGLRFVPIYLHIPMQILLPFLLLVMLWITKRFQKSH
ncbi:endospore germination permease [Bacillus sp. 1P10SD]|uniref:GerAB/ArcD/ProY family transporter n=1 Tax=Bacillus sp. 1P10SD TaxID=3132265 RepID=UPI0039A48962